ncbi:hypothetical protein DTO027B5_4141 [Paecilomyces variotii]|nr:hypothetical protein DTO021C3_423 [Paecilomyces variotii]KAJ9324290.1 hypothetical protein DTO027B3_4576 [Paecilomyces variotii]KAJ9334018.1 hypothetical protein DTO027B5_4141 [Paecilomyces variotii]KAJ9410666.1 hypothetical protein DTO045G8_1572 [Paecilomyces variotii]
MVHCTDVVNHSQQAAKLRAYIYLSSRTLNPRSQYHDSIRYVGAHDFKRSYYSLCAPVIQKVGPRLNSRPCWNQDISLESSMTATFGERTPVILTKVGIRNPCQLGFIAVGPFCPS